MVSFENSLLIQCFKCSFCQIYFKMNLFSDPFAEHFEKEISDDLANKLLADDKSKGAALWSSSEVMVCC